MVIDAANGVEPQTKRLLQVCRARNTPIITFINKMDREVREPLDLLAEIESHLGMDAVPFSWPVGMGKSFGGVFDIRQNRMRIFRAGQERRGDDNEFIQGLDNPEIARAVRQRLRPGAWGNRPDQRGRSALSTNRLSWPAGRPRCSSAPRSTTSACRKSWMRWWNSRPRPGPRPALQRVVQPDEPTLHRRGVQGAGQYGPGAPRPRGLRTRQLRPVRTRHAHEGMPHQQGNAAQQRRHRFCPSGASCWTSAYAGDVDRHPEPWRAATGRRADRRRNPAVHGPALLRARTVPGGGGRRTRCARSSCAPAWPSWARKAPSRCSARWPRAAPCCWARSASCSSKSCSIV